MANVSTRRGPLGLTLVDPVVAWLQLARSLTIDELVIAGDSLVRRKKPLATIAALHDIAEASPHVRGIRVLRAALLDVRSGTDSPRESETRLVLVRAGLPEPIVHHTVYDADGYFVGTPDLAYIEARVAIEYQGSHHWEDPAVFEDDIIRRELFRRAGWHVFLVTARTLQRPAQLAAEMSALLAERAPKR